MIARRGGKTSREPIEMCDGATSSLFEITSGTSILRRTSRAAAPRGVELPSVKCYLAANHVDKFDPVN